MTISETRPFLYLRAKGNVNFLVNFAIALLLTMVYMGIAIPEGVFIQSVKTFFWTIGIQSPDTKPPTAYVMILSILQMGIFLPLFVFINIKLSVKSVYRNITMAHVLIWTLLIANCSLVVSMIVAGYFALILYYSKTE